MEENNWISIGTVVGKQWADGGVKERRFSLYVRVINGEKFYAVNDYGFYHHARQVKNASSVLGYVTHSVCFDPYLTGKETNEPWYFAI